MQVMNRKQLTAELGKAGIFKSFPGIYDRMRYTSGISGFDSLPKKHKEGLVISFVGRPEGIEIRANDTGDATALRYDQIKSWDILEFNEKRHYLHIHLHHQKDLVFNFLQDKGHDIVAYFKKIGIERHKEERSESAIKEAILSLRAAYDLPPDQHTYFEQEFKPGPLVKAKTIKISSNALEWKGEVYELSNARGITYSKTEHRVNGIKTNTEFQIHLHLNEVKKPIKINFNKSVTGGGKQSELLYNNILDALFNTVTRRQIQTWLTKFSNNERVSCNNFELSRKGIHHQRKNEDRIILWEDLTLEFFQMNITFKSRYDKKNRILLGLPHDPDCWALYSLSEYLIKEPAAMRLLVG